MRLRPRRRNLVVWSSSAAPVGRHEARGFARPVRASRIRRWIRTGRLLTLLGLVHLTAAVRPRWRPLLTGTVLTAVGVVFRAGAAGVALLPGLLFLLVALLTPADPQTDRTRRRELERELAAYCTAAQRHDLEATFDRYPDDVTQELRDILARQAMSAGGRGGEG